MDIADFVDIAGGPRYNRSSMKFHMNRVCRHADCRSYRVAIETGTLFGDSALRLSRHFPRVYTIEINRELYEKAKARFRNNPGITVLFGDSRVVLRELVQELREPCLFFLDAHFSGDSTTDWKASRWKGYRIDTGYAGDEPTAENQVPLFEEMRLIHDRVESECVICIDDVDQFDESGKGRRDKQFKGEDWSHLDLNVIRDYLTGRLDIWTISRRQLVVRLKEFRSAISAGLERPRPSGSA